MHKYIRNEKEGCCSKVNLGNPATVDRECVCVCVGGAHRKRTGGNRECYAIAMQSAVHSVWPWGLQERERQSDTETDWESETQPITIDGG